MSTAIIGVLMFTGIIVALVCMILVARKQLVPAGDVKITINHQNKSRCQRRKTAGGSRISGDLCLVCMRWRWYLRAVQGQGFLRWRGDSGH